MSILNVIKLKFGEPHTKVEAAKKLGSTRRKSATLPLIAALRDGHADVRHAAVWALCNIRDARAVQPLCTLLGKEPVASVRDAIVTVTKYFKDSRCIESLIAVLSDSDKSVRREAASALGEIGDAHAVPALISALNDPDVRLPSIVSLGMLGDNKCVDSLIKVLDDDNRYVRIAAVEALGKIGDTRAATGLSRALMDIERSVREATAKTLLQFKWTPPSSELNIRYLIALRRPAETLKFGKMAIEPLLAELTDRLSPLRQSAGDVLVALGDIRAVQPLIDFLTEESPQKYALQKWAEKSIENLGEVATEVLINSLTHPNVRVSRVALSRVSGRCDARAVPGLINCLQRSELGETWCADAACELGRIGDMRAVEFLTPELNNRPPKVRSSVAEALGKIGDAQSAPRLIEALNDTDEDVRCRVAEAMGRIGDACAVEPLIAALNDNSFHVRIMAAQALGTIGDTRALKPLLAAAVKDDFKLPLKSILILGAKARPLLLPLVEEILKTSESLRARRYSAELFVRLAEERVKTYLPKIFLDWLETEAGWKGWGKDDGLRLIVEACGVDSDFPAIASSALGYTANIIDAAPGEKHTVEALKSYDGGKNAVVELCGRSDLWSSAVLFRVARKKDIVITLSVCGWGSNRTLSFEDERQAAREELIRRGLLEIDPADLIHI